MMKAANRLPLWTDVVEPHEDIREGRLEMSTYAANLGAVDAGLPHVPRVYRDPREFFRATYPTTALHQLLKDVLTVLGGGAGDRVIQLRTPFGGGKTHSLLALYHLVKARRDIEPRDLVGLPDPGAGRVAVLSGLDLDPWKPREVEGLSIHTLWGELAFRIGGAAAYEEVRVHDENGSPPGNDVLRPILGGRPVLILMDEVLVYVQRAGGRDGDHPFRKQILNFLQGLTELVRGLPNAALVYSLQASEHEAAGDQALLTDLDHLVTRIDAKREPVSDEEITRVVQRRLFPTYRVGTDEETAAREVAREFALAYGRVRETYAETAQERRNAAAEAERFEERVLRSYPFHPDLLDLMYHRWGSLPSYQRTRGALQFLARTVHAIWTGVRTAQPLIGPGDVALEDEHVRGAFFGQVGERERYQAVLAADITGGTARAMDVDERIGADSPAYRQLRVGTRTATAIMLYSFGGREGENRGVVEEELVQSLVSPTLDRNVITAALHDLREELLYLHHLGRRYRFEPKANLNLLIAQERKKFSPEEVVDAVRVGLDEALKAARDEAVLWPADSRAVADEVARFRVVYLGEPWVGADDPSRQAELRALVTRHGAGNRAYQNSLAFAIPGGEALDRSRRAGRTTLAIRSLLKQAKQYDLGAEQVEELRERERGALAELKGALDRLYEVVLVPVAERDGPEAFGFDVVDLRAQLAAGRTIHERLTDALRKHVFDSITPSRIVTLTGLSEDKPFVGCEELVGWFFSIFDFPKLRGEDALRDAIGRGVAATFGYCSSARVDEDRLVPDRKRGVWFGESLPAGDVDLGPGTYLTTPELARELRGEEETSTESGAAATNGDTAQQTGGSEAGSTTADERADVGHRRYHLRTAATAEQFFRILPALQNLADRSSRFVAKIEVDAEAKEAYDRSWLRNAVEEHLEEAGVEVEAKLE